MKSREERRREARCGGLWTLVVVAGLLLVYVLVTGTPAWIGAMAPLITATATLAGVALGIRYSERKDRRARRWRKRAHWAALRAEVGYCCHLAETYLQDNIPAPLYRLPTAAYAHAFPALLADGVPTESETHTIIRFFTEVHTLNRGLDLTQAAHERNDTPARQAEFARNRLKAERLVQDYGPQARAVVEAHR